MGLRELAEADLAFTLEDRDNGFGFDITVTDPAGTTLAMVGTSNDIAQVIDPDTGQAVSGRLAAVTLRSQTIIDSALSGIPEGVFDDKSKPWIIDFDDINGTAHKFKVRQSNPDRALGVVTCILELYE